jgi:hypothetical protein
LLDEGWLAVGFNFGFGVLTLTLYLAVEALAGMPWDLNVSYGEH